MESDFITQNEKALISRVKEGERAAFDELVKSHRNKGFAIAYSMVGNPEDAKDVLQEAFIRVYLNIKSFREQSKFSTWFYRVVVNCALDFLRRRKSMYKIFTQPIVDEEGNEKEAPDIRYEPSKIVLTQELSQRLDDCIDELPKMQKACFVLKHQDGFANQEIAEILGCSLSTVKVHLFRAVRALQDKLSAYLAV